MAPNQQSKLQEDQVRAAIQEAMDLADRAAATETYDNYELLEQQIDQLESQARNLFQSKIDLAGLLAKLSAAKPLTPVDLNTLELLIVGDAEYYLKYETELDEWKAQLRRVLDQITGLQASTLDVDGLMHIRALCREAHEVLADLVFYFEAKERAAKFKAATQGPINIEGYRFLAEVVRETLRSQEM
jgi:hypothetical protein